ncbi:MAG: 16S rRNA (guanine(966)-N(2))-methyltransferase RsmD [Nitrospira sp. CR1.3]|nr:16S rRNA (guanine(966)-N(2))-methyltransferase RsmD [Nitrospira sp. CR1.3]
MRVIAGSHRGRRLCGPQGTTLRPTSDKVREALFSILGSRVPGCRFLDLYAGTGAVGIEAMSRGAATVTFVESSPEAARLLRKNLTVCRLMEQADVRIGPTQEFLARRDWWNGPYDVVFADPPYAEIREVDQLRSVWTTELLAADGVMVIEQNAKAELPASLDRAVLVRRYVYGDTALLLYGPVKGETGSA